ncbi:copper resistance CopC family protein [Lysinibacillus fusiformis]|uniref:copper resistance CopC family protein n=1 Tax=Lysinibacillus fusiformis TaxID=28031 RepID=UPI000E32DA47|nr:copper resistance CopC family protein [Lysinibacillus fusiformis]AXQ50896.1 copper resistance protein CopC [Stenotrophomonas rhizophila]KAB0447233.1 hypothetical protein CH314_01165 [Lysinibacillus fusiformis]
MIKKVLMYSFFLTFLFGVQVEAHTPIETSYPKDGEIVKEESHEISMSFGTKIEQTSKVDIVNDKGVVMELANLTIHDNEMLASFYEPLENGSYQVNWSIVGEDGHPIEGTFGFTVEQVTGDIKSTQAVDEPTQQNETTANQSAEKDTKSNSQSNAPSYVLPLIIGVLAVIALVSTFILMRRKK